MSLRWFIYVLRDPITWAVRYVGKTNRPNIRIAHHLSDRRLRTRKGYWIASLWRRGLRPLFQVIDAGSGEGHPAAERAWIAAYRREGADLTNTGDGGLGFCDTPETRAKIKAWPRNAEYRQRISEAKKGRAMNADATRRMAMTKTGQRQSEATKAKRAASLTGRPVSPETRAKIAASKLGKPRDPAIVQKVAAKLRGRKASEETRERLRAAQQKRRAAEAQARIRTDVEESTKPGEEPGS